jgi:hypothetical protein
MLRKAAFLTAVLLATAPGIARAQYDPAYPRAVLFPGSLNISAGTVAPGEPGNVISSVSGEQGVALMRKGPLFVIGFVDVTARHDTDGLAWNRTTPGTGGVKLVAITRAGVIQAAVGVAMDARRDSIRASKAMFVNYWAGWRGDTGSSQRLLPDTFPGYAFASSGVITAAEPGNWITSVAVQQGVTVIRPFGVSAIPFVGASASADSAGFNWNNRTYVDGGVKFARSVGGGVVESGVARRLEVSHATGRTRSEPMVFVNYWLGWSPRYIAR